MKCIQKREFTSINDIKQWRLTTRMCKSKRDKENWKILESSSASSADQTRTTSNKSFSSSCKYCRKKQQAISSFLLSSPHKNKYLEFFLFFGALLENECNWMKVRDVSWRRRRMLVALSNEDRSSSALKVSDTSELLFLSLNITKVSEQLKIIYDFPTPHIDTKIFCFILVVRASPCLFTLLLMSLHFRCCHLSRLK